MLTYINKLLRSKKGQAMAEFTIATPVLFLMFSSILFFGRNLNNKISIRSSVRHAAFVNKRIKGSDASSKRTIGSSEIINNFFWNKTEVAANRVTFNPNASPNASTTIAAANVVYYELAFKAGGSTIHYIMGALFAAAQTTGASWSGFDGASVCETQVKTGVTGGLYDGSLATTNYDNLNITSSAKCWVDHDPGMYNSLRVGLLALMYADPFHLYGGFEWDFSSFTLGTFGDDESWWTSCAW
jgi:uncharacterized protein (UPF0333 family)